MRGLARNTRTLLLLTLLHLGCSPASHSPGTDPTPVHVNDPKAAAAASNLFGFDLYAKANTHDENLVLSPLSAAAALAMTASGARGRAKAKVSSTSPSDCTVFASAA